MEQAANRGIGIAAGIEKDSVWPFADELVEWGGVFGGDDRVAIDADGVDAFEVVAVQGDGFACLEAISDPVILFPVADKDNHRVLIWNKIPFGDGWNADICLGQEGMDEREPNRGEFDAVTAGTLSFPTGVFFDAEGDRLFVVDQGNSRVLIWNKVPNDFGRPADVVIGQKDFVTREPNAGHGYRKPNEIGLYFPTDVVFGKTGLFISDTGNHRVLYWKEVPTENGQPADLVFGQKTFYENRGNRGGDTTNTTFNDPFGMYLEEEIDEHYDPEDDEEQEEATPFKLYIADRGNSRVVVWNELPSAPQSEEEQEDDVFDVDMDDPDALIGDEDDDDDFFGDVAELEEGEESEEETSEETSSA